MTAPALNIASIVSAAQPGAGAAANPAGAGGLGGFEALLGALFPQADPAAAATPANGAAPSVTPAAVDVDALLAAGEADAEADTTVEAAPGDAQPTAGDAAAALVASLVAAQPPLVQTPATVAKDDAGKGAADKNGAATPPAWGRDKTKGAPATPAILAANPKAGLAEKAELAAGDEAAPTIEAAGPQSAEPPQQATGPARNAAPPPVPTPAPVRTAAATPMATPAEATPETPSTPAVEAAAELPPVETPAAPIAASPTPPPEAAAPPARPARAERAKNGDARSSETSADLKPLDAADKPAPARAAQGAAKAASARIEATDGAEAKPQEAKAAPESPDAAPQGETRAAAQSTASAAAHAGHVVRGSPETVANLAAQIVKKLEGKATRFDLELDPHGLGRVDVRIEIGAHGRMTAGMTFDNPQAAADVKARAAELQRALEQAGFDISGGLSFDVAGDRGQQQQNQAWQDPGEAGRAFQGRAFRAALETAGDAADAANQGALRLRRGVNAGLDVRI